MPPNSEIEKLERRWKENPKGTVFAPYAEVLRKHGDHLLARDVLRQGLELHPDHIPGNIVLGRCCLDLREDGPAEAAFTHVLDLDPENVIALKALADITERQGRLMEAATWLSRLISVDPSNDEARDQLARVDAAREAAAAAMSAPLTQSAGQAPEPSRAEDITEALPVLPRASAVSPPAPAPAAEVGVGQILDEDTDLALDAHFGNFEVRPVEPAPLLPKTREVAISREVLAQDVAPPSPPPAPLDIIELDPIEEPEPPMAAPIANFSAGPELSPAAPPPGEVFALNQDEAAPIDLRPSSASEFQTPDASNELLDLTPGRSEFQVPDASAELTLSASGGTEYQTPSGSEELLRIAERQAAESVEPEAVAEPELLPEPAMPPALEEPPRPYSQVITTGFAAISLMPTEEMSTEPPVEPVTAPAMPAFEMTESVLEPEPEVEPMEVEGLELAEQPEASGAMEPEPEMDMEPTESLLDVLASASAPPPAADVAPAHESDLKLIFPEDADTPEPPRRRITEAVAAPVEPEVTEPGIVEPAPVMTESMAELYVRQGHLAEAINVYRALAERSQGDPRLEARIQSLQAALGAGSRRMSYVAMDTGGESVESFFRSLADARPAGAAAHRPMVEDLGGGAPTRPTNDPLSLSAIFGEEASAAAQSQAVTEVATKPPAPDAFSFDQFFGGSLSGSGAGATGAGRPEGEDLDQFQHWLKSLKK